MSCTRIASIRPRKSAASSTRSPAAGRAVRIRILSGRRPERDKPQRTQRAHRRVDAWRAQYSDLSVSLCSLWLLLVWLLLLRFLQLPLSKRHAAAYVQTETCVIEVSCEARSIPLRAA